LRRKTKRYGPHRDVRISNHSGGHLKEREKKRPSWKCACQRQISAAADQEKGAEKKKDNIATIMARRGSGGERSACQESRSLLLRLSTPIKRGEGGDEANTQSFVNDLAHELPFWPEARRRGKNEMLIEVEPPSRWIKEETSFSTYQKRNFSRGITYPNIREKKRRQKRERSLRQEASTIKGNKRVA